MPSDTAEPLMAQAGASGKARLSKREKPIVDPQRRAERCGGIPDAGLPGPVEAAGAAGDAEGLG
jgi:hypothetical protein